MLVDANCVTDEIVKPAKIIFNILQYTFDKESKVAGKIKDLPILGQVRVIATANQAAGWALADEVYNRSVRGTTALEISAISLLNNRRSSDFANLSTKYCLSCDTIGLRNGNFVFNTVDTINANLCIDIVRKYNPTRAASIFDFYEFFLHQYSQAETIRTTAKYAGIAVIPVGSIVALACFE